MKTLDIYNKLRRVPISAKKKITGGRLNNMTDINPMWRIKQLTDVFGPCGIGWKYVITSQRLEPGADGEIAAFVDIDLFYKWNDVWSEAVPGIGGNSFVSKETKGLYTSDECFKSALSDAISVAGKAIGLGADVWFEKDIINVDLCITELQIKKIYALAQMAGIDADGVQKVIAHDFHKKYADDLTWDEYTKMCERLQAKK